MNAPARRALERLARAIHVLEARARQPTDHRALDLARTHRERGHEAWALRLLAEIQSTEARLDVEQAADSFRQALALAEELGMRPLAAHCGLGLGALYRRAGQSERAQEHLTGAIAMFREMDAPSWLFLATEIANA